MSKAFRIRLRYVRQDMVITYKFRGIGSMFKKPITIAKSQTKHIFGKIDIQLDFDAVVF